MIAEVGFTNGTWRPVHGQPVGRQYVVDDQDERVYGVWLVPADGADEPLVVSGCPEEQQAAYAKG